MELDSKDDKMEEHGFDHVEICYHRNAVLPFAYSNSVNTAFFFLTRDVTIHVIFRHHQSISQSIQGGTGISGRDPR
jgi:hypothetical protein